MKKNNKIFIPVILLFVAILIYTLGFSSNLSYANKDYILRPVDYPIDDFNDKVQPFNNLLFSTTIVLFILLIGVYATNSHRRTKFLTSNVISVSLLSTGMIVFSIINFVKLPTFIREYSELLKNHQQEFERFNRVYSLISSNIMYYIGLVLALISLLYAIFMIVKLVKRMKNQREYIAKRSEVLANAK